jgi:hypothetical protein
MLCRQACIALGFDHRAIELTISQYRVKFLCALLFSGYSYRWMLGTTEINMGFWEIPEMEGNPEILSLKCEICGSDGLQPLGRMPELGPGGERN